MIRKQYRIFLLVLLAVIFAGFGLYGYQYLNPRVKEEITIEAGESIPSAAAFLMGNENKASYITDIASINTNKTGTYELQYKVNRRKLTGVLKIIDTTPPSAVGKKLVYPIGVKLKAKAFISKMKDNSSVTVAFANNPDFKKEGKQQLTILLTDEWGNTAKVTAQLTLLDIKSSITIEAGAKKVDVNKYLNTTPYKIFMKTDLKDLNLNVPNMYDIQINVNNTNIPAKLEVIDTTAPVIKGAKDKTVYIGDTVSYKKDITVTDNTGETIKLQVDSSQVNLKKAGSYTVVYSAKDASGNKTELPITVTVKEAAIDKAALNKKALTILAEITDPSMTKEEAARAIYNWVKSNIAYTGYSDKSDWVKEAYKGLTDRKGDCFTYFAVSKELLELNNIETLDITRVGGRTRHYWSLINCGKGWYHFDSCPHTDHKNSFMLTDEELENLSKSRGSGSYYYKHNKSLYPSTPVH